MTSSLKILSSLKSPPVNDRHKGFSREAEALCLFFSYPYVVRVVFTALVWFFSVVVDGGAEELSKNFYVDELVIQAFHMKLSEEREWRLLLHYRENLFGGYTSEQDDPGFFLSPEGKTEPAAELAATLRQFASTEFVGRSKQPAQC